MPQLKRVIATTGTNVVMEPTLNEAILSLYGKTTLSPGSKDDADRAAQEIIEKIAPQLEEVKALWQEMQNALQKGNWEQFGKKMEEINGLMEEAE